MKVILDSKFNRAVTRNIKYYSNAILSESPSTYLNASDVFRENPRYNRFSNNIKVLKKMESLVNKVLPTIRNHEPLKDNIGNIVTYYTVIEDFMIFYLIKGDYLDVFWITYNVNYNDEGVKVISLLHTINNYILK